MLYYIKKYPVSLLIIAIAIYLSFFRPPINTDLSKIPNLDKIAHMGIYFIMSGGLWFEFFKNYRSTDRRSIRRAWFGACLCPILFSGAVELLQEYLTVHRGGEWLDFAANTMGAVSASLLAFCIVRFKKDR